MHGFIHQCKPFLFFQALRMRHGAITSSGLGAVTIHRRSGWSIPGRDGSRPRIRYICRMTPLLRKCSAIVMISWSFMPRYIICFDAYGRMAVAELMIKLRDAAIDTFSLPDARIVQRVGVVSAS